MKHANLLKRFITINPAKLAYFFPVVWGGGLE